MAIIIKTKYPSKFIEFLNESIENREISVIQCVCTLFKEAQHGYTKAEKAGYY